MQLDGHLTEVSGPRLAWHSVCAAGASGSACLPAGAWEHLVLSGVLLGAVAWWILAFVRIMRFQRLIREIGPAAEEWQARTAELARSDGDFRDPDRFALCPGGYRRCSGRLAGRPRLLVPSELWRRRARSSERRSCCMSSRT